MSIARNDRIWAFNGYFNQALDDEPNMIRVMFYVASHLIRIVSKTTDSSNSPKQNTRMRYSIRR